MGGGLVRTRVLVSILVALAISGCTAAETIDYSRDPQTVMVAVPEPVGSSLTIGAIGPDVDAPRPVRMLSISVEMITGAELVGVGAFDPDVVGSGIGAVPGWPPGGYEIPAVDDATYETDWHGMVQPVVGIRTTAERAGLRGITVRWLDGAGKTTTRTVDLAVLWCAPGACTDEERDSDGPLLRELGLVR